MSQSAIQVRVGSHNTVLWTHKAGGARTTATTCTEMPSLEFSTAGILLHQPGESELQDVLSSASTDQDLPPVTFPPGPAHRPQTERKVAPDFTD